MRHAGPLQMVMLYYSCEGVTNLEHLSRLDGPQFRSMMMNAKASAGWLFAVVACSLKCR